MISTNLLNNEEFIEINLRRKLSEIYIQSGIPVKYHFENLEKSWSTEFSPSQKLSGLAKERSKLVKKIIGAYIDYLDGILNAKGLRLKFKDNYIFLTDMILDGGKESGKTFLLSLIAQAAINKGYKVKYVSWVDYLDRFQSFETRNNNEDFLYFVGERTTSVYIDLLKNFIILMFDKINIKYSQEIENIIINNCKNISLQFLDKFDKSNILLLYQFLHTYQSIFSLDNELLNNIFEIIKKKYETEIYILNPTLNDLLNDNIYKLSIDNIIYYVPLWFNELTFENNNNNEINVICIPEIENNISIDEENNLTYYFSYLFNIDIFDKEYLEIIINLDNNSKKSFNIPTQELYIKKKQIYTFKNEGILKKKNCIFNLNETNQINKSYRSDIIICITFLFE